VTRSLWKPVRRLLAVVFLFAVLLLTTFAILLNTETGSRFVVSRIAAAVPDSLNVEDVEGTLWRDLHIRLLAYRSSKVDLRATDVDVTISWPNLFRGAIVLKRINAEEIELRNLSPASVEPVPLDISMPPLPIHIGIGQAQVGTFRFAGAATETLLQKITIENAEIEESRITLDAGAAVVAGTGVELANVDTILSGDVPLAAEVNWQRTDGTWSGQGSVSGSLAEMTLSHLLNQPYEVSTDGVLHLQGRLEPEFDLQFTWQRYVIADAELTNGDVRVRGTMRDYSTAFSVRLSEPRIPDIAVSGTANGNTDGFSESDVRLQSAQATVVANGRINWLPVPSASLSVQATDFDPALLSDQLTGLLSAHGQFDLLDTENWRVSNVEIAGNLNGSDLVASGDLEKSPAQLRCATCEVTMGANRIVVDGYLAGDAIALDFDVDAPSIEDLQALVSGGVQAKGHLEGTTSAPVFVGSVEATALRYGTWGADSIKVDSDGSGQDLLDLRLVVTTLTRDDSAFGSFTGRLSGAPGNLDVDMTWNLRDMATISAFANIIRTDLGVRGTVDRAAIEETYSGRSILSAPLTFTFEEGTIEIGPHRWLLPDGQVDVTRALVTPEQIAIVAKIENLPLSTANAWLPKQYQLGGTINADIDVARTDGDWLGSVDWRQADTVLYIAGSEQTPFALKIPEAVAEIDLADGGARVESMIRIDPGISFRTTAQFADLSTNPLIDGRVRVDGEDWSFVSALIPELANFGGDLSADFSAKGPLLSPALSGQASWLDGSAGIPAVNVPLTKVNITASGAADGSATISGSAMAGTGSIEISGRIEDLMQSSRRIELAVTGNAADIVDWPDYQIRATPDLVVVGAAGGWDATGKLDVPQAEISVRELVESAVTVSPDVVLPDTDFSTPRSAARYSGEARLTLGDDVHISAFGLDTNVAGSLLVRKTPDQELTAEGRIRLVGGKFVAYGQRLTIEEGTLTFTGPLDNPIVDVRATRTIENFQETIVAGIRLQGRANNITSTVYSEPSMAEADALSYLMIGRPLAEATSSEGGDLSSAALGLGLRQASRVTEQIGQSVGLDQLSIIGDGGDSTALVAGKQINSRLYARYAYGVFSRLGIILIRYKLTERLSLEAGTGESQSLDILYSVDKE